LAFSLPMFIVQRQEFVHEISQSQTDRHDSDKLLW